MRNEIVVIVIIVILFISIIILFIRITPEKRIEFVNTSGQKWMQTVFIKGMVVRMMLVHSTFLEEFIQQIKRDKLIAQGKMHETEFITGKQIGKGRKKK